MSQAPPFIGERVIQGLQEIGGKFKIKSIKNGAYNVSHGKHDGVCIL